MRFMFHLLWLLEYNTASTQVRNMSEEQAIVIPQGSAKDHRPALKQAILELLVSQESGGPIFPQSGDGNSSDKTRFKERSGALIRSFSEAEAPRVLGADATL